jgi:DNA-binding NtrC family response regulator
MSEAPRIRVLLAEDERALGAILSDYLTQRGHHVVHVTDGRAALDALATQAFDVALLDIVMPEMDGLTVLRALRESAEPPEAIIITGNGTIDTAITALKLGAYDYMSKPYRMLEIEMQINRAWEKRELLRQNSLLADRLARADRVTEVRTTDPQMREVLSMVEQLAPTSSPVLITGERGTGRHLIAQAMHRLSPRASRAFTVVSCGEGDPATLEAELFGVEGPGSAWPHGARPGRLETAHGGTVFLDNVEQMDLRSQGRLLRLLEDGAVIRVGGTRRLDVDVRIVAATTNGPDGGLMAAVERRTFRSDLSYKLGAFSIRLPALRERPSDIVDLAQHFLALYGGPRLRFSDAAIAAMQQYAWPGNVTELRTVIERAALLATSPVVEAHTLGVVPVLQETALLDDAALSLTDLERRHIDDVLRREGWHQGRASAVLGISAKTLYRKIREYGLERPAGGR